MAQPDAVLPRRPVILLHGLWLGAWSMIPLARGLSRRGLVVHRFGYRSTRMDVSRHAARLTEFAAQLPGSGQGVDLVAHSFGGIVALHAASKLGQATGRMVLLGTPLGGSRTANRLRNWPGGERMLGAASGALCRPAPTPPEGWQVGMIAGRTRLGLGLLAGGGRFEGDGTVALAETRADYLSGHLVLAESHSSLQVSPRVARAAAVFLETGGFQDR